MTPTRAPFDLIFGVFFASLFGPPFFRRAAKKGALLGPPGATLGFPGGPKRARSAKNACARNAFFSVRGRKVPKTPQMLKSSFYLSENTIFGGPGGSQRDPWRPPGAHKGAPGTAEKRKRREAEERSEQRRFGETSEKRPDAKSKKKVRFGGPKRYPFEGYAGTLFRSFFPPRSRPSPEGVPGAIWEPFGTHFGRFGTNFRVFSRLLLPHFRGNIRTKIMQQLLHKTRRHPEQPHPQAQTLRVRRSRASVFNPPPLAGVFGIMVKVRP